MDRDGTVGPVVWARSCFARTSASVPCRPRGPSWALRSTPVSSRRSTRRRRGISAHGGVGCLGSRREGWGLGFHDGRAVIKDDGERFVRGMRVLAGFTGQGAASHCGPITPRSLSRGVAQGFGNGKAGKQAVDPGEDRLDGQGATPSKRLLDEAEPSGEARQRFHGCPRGGIHDLWQAGADDVPQASPWNGRDGCAFDGWGGVVGHDAGQGFLDASGLHDGVMRWSSSWQRRGCAAS